MDIKADPSRRGPEPPRRPLGPRPAADPHGPHDMVACRSTPATPPPQWGWLRKSLATTVPAFSPRDELAQSWTTPHSMLSVATSEQWRPQEQYTRYAISATHPLNRQVDVGLYAGHENNQGKPADFAGAGFTIRS